MSQQEQPRRRPSDQQHAVGSEEQGAAMRHGDVLQVSGDIAGQPIALQAEGMAFGYGQTLKGGPAATMQSAATANERTGVVRHDQATDATTEFVAGQYLAPDDAAAGGAARGGGGAAADETKVTIGEVLEAAALAAGDVPIEPSDAVAILAAEAKATGLYPDVAGGLALQAETAEGANEMVARKDKTTLGDVLADAESKLVADRSVDSSDALGVADAESRNRGDATARPGGVAASMAVAARINRDETVWD